MREQQRQCFVQVLDRQRKTFPLRFDGMHSGQFAETAFVVALLIEAATLHTSANLKVVDLADDRAEEIAAAGEMVSHGMPTGGQANADQA